MHPTIHMIAPIIAWLSLTTFASAQSTTPQPPPSQSSPAAQDDVEDLTQTTLTSPASPAPTTSTPTAPPSTPTAPAAQPSTGASPTSASASTRTFPVPPTTKTPAVESPESARIREGFYLRITAGLGYVSVAGNGPQGTAKISGLGDNSLIAIGGSIVRGLVLAGTIQSASVTRPFKGGPFVGESVTSNGQSKAASSEADAASSELGLLVDWYPNPSGGWHAGLSAGLGSTSVMNHADNSTMVGASAGGSIFGGYDWALGSDWSLGLALLGAGTGSTSMKDSSSRTDTGYRLRSFSVGLAGSILYF